MAPEASSFLSLTLHCSGFVVGLLAVVVVVMVKDDSVMELALLYQTMTELGLEP